jgi:hypothetical protein
LFPVVFENEASTPLLKLVSFTRTITTRSQESAELLAESGIIEKLVDDKQASKYLKRLFELFGDILGHVPG